MARQILEEFWPETYHDDIAAAVGLDLSPPAAADPRRDPGFRRNVLIAYQRCCAICGFNAQLGDALLGIDAAHIQFKQNSGPDEVTNGLALCSLHHKAFDRGAIGFDRTFRVLVSQELTGYGRVEDLLLRFNGQRLATPISDTQVPARVHIDWHLANVFRQPAR